MSKDSHDRLDGRGLPAGWYYFGPQPPWDAEKNQATPPGQAEGDQGNRANAGHANWNLRDGEGPHRRPDPKDLDDNEDLKEAFDRISRGDIGADTIAKLFNVRDRDFWVGAIGGSIVALALNNLPQIKMMLAMLTASGGPGKSGQAQTRTTAPAPSGQGNDTAEKEQHDGHHQQH
ncbi:MAG: hypothetical protein AB7U46_13500 [Paenirhodobacter sp.]|uniref:hypothetical protein n=1 Tax=Paenirhodobacter sp. TaxID=1965326 RepID=UPI003D0E2035